MKKQVRNTAVGRKAATGRINGENAFGVKTFIVDDRREGGYDAVAARHGLKVVEQFEGNNTAKDMYSPEFHALLLINDAGETFKYVAREGNHTTKLTLAESVRFYAKRFSTLTDGNPGEAFFPWLELVADALEMGTVADTFRLAPDLAREVHAAAQIIGAPPEWVVHDALKGLERDVADDRSYLADTRGVYRSEVKRKVPCRVTKLN
jgi:hypothetical protein